MTGEPLNERILGWAQSEKLERLIIVRPTNDGSSYLERMYTEAELDRPEILANWETQELRNYLDLYKDACAHTAELIEIYLNTAVVVFDRGLTDERVVITYGISTPPAATRDASRIARYPNPNVSVQKRLGADAFPVDRGHFIAHSAGGGININLFPQRSTLNRGHSDPDKPEGQGRRYREMERHAADNPGTFLFSRPIYDDSTWIPHSLHYGVLKANVEWWTETFENK